MLAVREEGRELSAKTVQQKLDEEDVAHLAALLMKEEYEIAVPWEEYVRPLKLGQLQKEYREHTERANRLAPEDPEESKKEMLACIRLSREIRALQGKHAN